MSWQISFPIRCIKFLRHIEEPALKRIEQLAIFLEPKTRTMYVTIVHIQLYVMYSVH